MSQIIYTNNPLVNERLSKQYNVEYLEDKSYLDVLKTTRDKVHLGYSLETHPLSGSIKPNETPYKSLVIGKSGDKLDLKSIYMIEDSIQVATKFLNDQKPRKYSDSIYQDFQVIDYDLISNAIGSMQTMYGGIR